MTVLLMTAGLGAINVASATAASSSASCFPATDTNVGLLGDFTASTSGSGTGNVSIETVPASFEGTGRLSWSANQTVTGTSGPTPSMTGTLNFAVAQGGHTVSFVSSCILEAGVFAGEMEDDPFDPEANHTAIRGIEGEWIGTAYNYPSPGQQTKVVASLAVWTTSAGPRFHLDVSTGTFPVGACPLESDAAGSIGAGGPTAPNSNVVVTAPALQAGWGSCAA